MKAVKKIFIFLLAMILGAGAAITVLQYATPYKPFRSTEEEAELTAVSGESTEGLTLTAERASGNVQTLTATVKDANGTVNPDHQGVTFRVAWSQAHAEPLEQYLVWTTNGSTVTLTCKKALNTTITVTCRSVVDPTKFATVTLGYETRVTKFTMSGQELLIGSHGEGAYTVSCIGASSPMYLIENVKYGTGTTQPKSEAYITITPTSELSDRLRAISSEFSNSLSLMKQNVSTAVPFGFVFYELLGPLAGGDSSTGYRYMSAISDAVKDSTFDFHVEIIFAHPYGATEKATFYIDIEPTW